jgi:uncharacterized protein
VRIVVLADTHIPDFAKALPAGIVPALRTADLILHAGDVNAAWVLDELADFAPVRAVTGNNDRPDIRRWGAREKLVMDLDGLPVAMVHDGGPKEGRVKRLRHWFPDARLIVFAHSHVPVNEIADGVRFFNPGSATWKRRQDLATYGRLTISRGRIRRARIVELPPR